MHIKCSLTRNSARVTTASVRRELVARQAAADAADLVEREASVVADSLVDSAAVISVLLKIYSKVSLVARRVARDALVRRLATISALT